jgi:hypothetical protein
MTKVEACEGKWVRRKGYLIVNFLKWIFTLGVGSHKVS